MIKAEPFQEFLKSQQNQQPTSIAEAFEELHQICIEENYTFEVLICNDHLVIKT